jgi:adenosylhomocysteine nucleosidase
MAAPIALVYAFKEEIQSLLNEVRIHKTIRHGAVTLREGEFRGVPVVLCKTDIGLERAQKSMATLLSNYHPDCVLSLGCAGACRSDLKTGDLIVIDEVRDETATSSIVIPKKDRSLLEALIREEDLSYQTGRLVSVVKMATAGTKKSLGAQGAMAVDMETIAIARATTTAGIAFAALRVIFDDMHEELPWTQGASETGSPVIAILKNPKSLLKIPRYFRMSRVCQKNLYRPIARWIMSQGSAE